MHQRLTRAPRRTHAWATTLATLTLLGMSLWRYGRPGHAAAVPPAATPAAAAAPLRPCGDEQGLARAYAPALALAPGDEAPRPVELMLDRAHLVYRDDNHTVEEARVDGARLASLGYHPEAFLKLSPAVDDRAGERRLYAEAVDGDRDGRYPITTYAHVECAATNPGLADRIVVQYWLFYLYNDAANVHQGDWEMVQIVLDGSQRPLLADYAQHGWYTWRRWDDVLVEARDTDGDGVPEAHPRVYVARGSHANYFQYTPAGYGTGGGDQVSDAAPVIPSVRLLPGADEDDKATSWLRFPGHWGAVPPDGVTCAACNAGPLGPVYNSGGVKWKTPLEWGVQRPDRDDLAIYPNASVAARPQQR